MFITIISLHIRRNYDIFPKSNHDETNEITNNQQNISSRVLNFMNK